MVLGLVATVLPAGAASAGSPVPGQPQRVNRGAASGDPTTVRRDALGRAHFVGQRSGAALAHASSAALTRPAAALEQLRRFAPAFGVTEPARDLRTLSVDDVGDGRSTVRFQQTAGGIPVFAGQLVSSLDESDDLLSVSGEVTQSVTTDGFAVAAAAARVRATAVTARAEQLAVRTMRATAPTRWLYDASLLDSSAPAGARSVWRVEVTSTAAPDVRELVLVDATTGAVALNYNQVARDLVDDKVCDNKKSVATAYRCDAKHYVAGSPLASSSADVREAYANAERTADFYKLVGDGVDLASLIGSNYGDGKKLRSTVRFCPGGCPYENAFWDGYQMVYGPDFAVADDVVGHELTHGVTQHTSGLAYWYQSGAINESMSDVFGELIDLHHDSTTPRWIVGEDLPDPEFQRDMAVPGNHHQPGVVRGSYWATGRDDSGGVHTNSGPGNRAATLIANGFGAVSDPEGATVKTGRLYWLVEHKLTPGSDYADLATALYSACTDLALSDPTGFDKTADCDGTVASAVATTKMAAFPAPSAPGNVHFSGGDNQIRLTWTAPPESVNSYLLTVDPPVGIDNYVAIEGNEREAVIGGIPGGRTYTFSLRAVSAAGTSPAVTRTLTGSRLSIATPPSVVYGSRTPVAGTLTSAGTGASGAGLASRTVKLYRHRAGVAGYQYLAATTTSTTGHYAFHPTASRDSSYFVRFPASSTVYLGNHTAKHPVDARQKVTLSVSDTSVRKGALVRFTGRVRPTRHGKVRLQRRRGATGGWTVVSRDALDARGRYVLSMRPRSRVDFTWRVVVGGTPVLSAGRSRMQVVRVR